VADAFYLPTPDPGIYTATEWTTGPWDPALQHGGPPSALLTRAIEQQPGTWPFTTVRVATEILGPVPVGEVHVSSTVARSGRSVELIEAEIAAGGRTAVKARAWRIRRNDVELPDLVAVPTDRPPLPDTDETTETWRCPFLEALEWRHVKGGFSIPGPGTLWARQRIPLVPDEEPTGLQRLMALADCGNGVSSALPLGWLFINPDLTVHLSRYPDSEWLCIEAQTTADPHGFGLATSTLYDEAGEVGRGAQSLYVGPR
jgi:hypothetical protein